MAISEVHYRILKKLREDGTLPACVTLLNIGQPNWYGDMDGVAMAEELATIVHPICAPKASSRELAEFCYRVLFDAKRQVSIDAGGDESAIKADLNKPMLGQTEEMSQFIRKNGTDYKIYNRFDLVVNHGTAEHIFNIAQVFRTMHDHCRVGGHMIHEAPCTGWVDHGFYCLQPTLFWDVAAANQYNVKFMAFTHISLKRTLPIENREAVSLFSVMGGPPTGSMLFVVLQKTVEAAFQIPQQGVYAGNVSQRVQDAWRTLR